MTPPVTHMRRVMANRTECDPEDDRHFADDPSLATCAACRDAYAKRAAEWHRTLRRRHSDDGPLDG